MAATGVLPSAPQLRLPSGGAEPAGARGRSPGQPRPGTTRARGSSGPAPAPAGRGRPRAAPRDARRAAVTTPHGGRGERGRRRRGEAARQRGGEAAPGRRPRYGGARAGGAERSGPGCRGRCCSRASRSWRRSLPS